MPTLVLNKLTIEDVAKHTFIETNEEEEIPNLDTHDDLIQDMSQTFKCKDKHSKHIHSGQGQPNMKTVQDQLDQIDPSLLEFNFQMKVMMDQKHKKYPNMTADEAQKS